MPLERTKLRKLAGKHEKTCPRCYRVFTGRRNRIYCTSNCNAAALQHKYYQKVRKSYGEAYCQRKQCHKLFTRTRPHHRFCSEKCMKTFSEKEYAKARKKKQLQEYNRKYYQENRARYKPEEDQESVYWLRKAAKLKPQVRSECGVQRPCPFVSCRYHTYLDVRSKAGSIKFNFPGKEVWEIDPRYSCALDIADQGGKTFDVLAVILGMTKQRIEQIQTEAFVRILESTNRKDFDL